MKVVFSSYGRPALFIESAKSHAQRLGHAAYWLFLRLLAVVGFFRESAESSVGVLAWNPADAEVAEAAWAWDEGVLHGSVRAFRARSPSSSSLEGLAAVFGPGRHVQTQRDSTAGA